MGSEKERLSRCSQNMLWRSVCDRGPVSELPVLNLNPIPRWKGGTLKTEYCLGASGTPLFFQKNQLTIQFTVHTGGVKWRSLI